MIPLRDNIKYRQSPHVTILLIALNIVVFLGQIFLEHSERPWRGDLLIYVFGIVPASLDNDTAREEVLKRFYVHVLDKVDEQYGGALGRLWRGADRRATLAQVNEDFDFVIQSVPVLGWLTILTSMFLHGGILHILSNMWFLWLFGKNVEARLGKAKFILFYFLCGIAAGLVHIFSNPDSLVPTIGASGAIGGVLGAYIGLFPHAKVLTLIPFFFFWFLRELPAWFFLGIWFLIEWLSAQSLSFVGDESMGGVAHWAHVGGFLAGFLLVWFLVKRKPPRSHRIHYRIR